MRGWLEKCLCIVAILGVLDGPMMLVQGWAWMNMLMDRTPEMGVSAALDSTFSGKNPCSMCCAIEQQRQDREEEAPVPEIRPIAKYVPVTWSYQRLPIPNTGAHVPVPIDGNLAPDQLNDPPSLPPPQRG